MKIKKSDLLNMIQEQNDVIAKLIRQVNCHHEDIIRLESVIEPEPQLVAIRSKSDIAKELLEVDLSSELTGSDLTRSILSKQFMQACLVSDLSDKAACQGDDLQLIRMYNETDGTFISMRDPWYGCHHKYAVAVDNNRKPLTASEVGL